MCGRFHRFASLQDISDQFRARVSGELLAPPTYNAPPQSMQPVIRLDENGEREIVLMRWGLVPYWSKDDKIGFSTFNARAETILTSNTFRNAMKKRRCLVPVNGFYEWRKLEKGVKNPYAIGMKDGSAFAFAGLWELWVGADGRRLETFTIITCDPNELVQQFHDRMPVILDAKDYTRWLEPGDPQQPPTDLLRPYPAELMRAWRIGPDVGNVRNNQPDLIDPIDEGGLF